MAKQEQKQVAVSDTDRLAKAIISKVEEVVVADRTLNVCKWNYWTSIKLSARLVEIIKNVLSSVRDSAPNSALTLMQMDISGLLEAHAKDILEITAETIARGNFNSVADAQQWIEDELGFAEVAEIFTVIARQNLRPFGKVFRNAVDLVRSARGQAAPPPPTSSPNSSKEVTRTKP